MKIALGIFGFLLFLWVSETFKEDHYNATHGISNSDVSNEAFIGGIILVPVLLTLFVLVVMKLFEKKKPDRDDRREDRRGRKG